MTVVDRHCSRRRAIQAIALTCLLAIAACSESSPTATRPESSSPQSLRIVSLSPAISRTLVDLELGDHIVGRTPYCDSIDQSIPVVGDLTNVNFEMLVQLTPTHVLVQPPIAGVDPHLQRVADEHGWVLAAWHLNGIVDIRRMLREMPERIYHNNPGAKNDLEATTMRLVAEIDDAIAPAGREQQPALTGRVLMVSDINPVMAFGSGTYLDDIVRALGGVNAVTDRGWVQLSLEDVVRLAPESVVLVRPGAKPGDLIRDLGPLATIDVPAVREGRLALLAHRDALAPSSGIVGVATDMKTILRDLARGQ